MVSLSKSGVASDIMLSRTTVSPDSSETDSRARTNRNLARQSLIRVGAFDAQRRWSKAPRLLLGGLRQLGLLWVKGAAHALRSGLAIERQNNASAYGTMRMWTAICASVTRRCRTSSAVMLQELVRADCVIQAVDIGGLRGGDEVRLAKNKQGLFMLANGTGGELFENFNNLNEAMSKMLERTSVTYVLAFHAENLKLDGKFHKLQVLLEGRPDGFRVVHRPGYFAPRPYSELSQGSESCRLPPSSSGSPAESWVSLPWRLLSRSPRCRPTSPR